MRALQVKKRISGCEIRKRHIKKGRSHFLQTQRAKFEFMKRFNKEFSLLKMAKFLGVSRSGFYKNKYRKPSVREEENEKLKKEVEISFIKSRKTYGSPRIHKELKKQGEKCSRKRIAKLMREQKIEPKMRKKWKKGSSVNKAGGSTFPNQVKQK